MKCGTAILNAVFENLLFKKRWLGIYIMDKEIKNVACLGQA